MSTRRAEQNEPGASAGGRIANTIRPDTVFRLRHIPEKYGRDNIPNLLRQALCQDEYFAVHVGSLSRSPYRPDEQVATVSIPEARNVLPRTGNGLEWQLDLNIGVGEKLVLHLDVHFQGLTPLHDGEDAGLMTDIIAVSGLNGHAYGSFKQRGGSFMWLRDGLPRDLRGSRVFIYGPDTQLQGSSSVQNLTDLSLKFRTALADFLPAPDMTYHQRPILFIGHSLGGLIIKEAFVHMKDGSYSDILSATCGFLFFGVPNLGMATESLIPMVGNQPNRGLLETLGRNSALLRRHQDEFPRIFEPSRIRITSFYETKLSPTACMTEDGWKMQGREDLLVDFASATIGSTNYHPIDRSHSDMVKFSGVDDPDYRATLVQIRQLRGDTGFRQHDSGPSFSSDDLACLRSLAFQAQDWHGDGIVSADGTCNWIFSQQEFQTWFQGPRQLLWIRGKPGSGKSTVMKHIFQSLDQWKTDGLILATFFFNGRSDKFLTTLLALYRALLNQVLRHFPEHLSDLTSSYKQKEAARKGTWNWTVDELHRFFATVIPMVSAKHHVCILVDALDESGEENARRLIMQFQKVLDAVDKNGGILKICFSCRHYPIPTLDSGLTIIMEQQNQQDIETVVRERLQRFRENERTVLENEILSKAEGIFQWACLVTDRASFLSTKRKPFHYIFEEIKRIPNELEQLYRSLLSNPQAEADPVERRQTLKLFRWMCLAVRPLTLAETQHALAIDAEMTFRSMDEYMRRGHFTPDENDMPEVVKDLSRGLAEFRKHGHEFALEPIHQTVLDYLLEFGLRELHESAGSDPLKSGHYYIFKSCVKFLNLREIIQTAPAGWNAASIRQSRSYSQPLLEYSLLFLLHHLHRAGRDEIVSGDLLGTFNWPFEALMVNRWATLWQPLSHSRYRNVRHQQLSIAGFSRTGILEPLDWPVFGSRLLHLAALLGKSEILDLIVDKDPTFDPQPRDSAGRSPLIIALQAGQEYFALKLLWECRPLITRELVANPWPAAHLAAARGLNTVLSISSAYGMDPNARIERGQNLTLLSAAVQNRQQHTCRLLINHGANPNMLDGSLHSPLSRAMTLNSEDLCHLLLSMGAHLVQALDIIVRRVPYMWRGRSRFIALVNNPLGQAQAPLHAAVEQSMVEVVLFLILDCGFDVNLEDASGRSPLFIAVEGRDLTMMKCLVWQCGSRFLTERDWSRLPFDPHVRDMYGEVMQRFERGELWFFGGSLPLIPRASPASEAEEMNMREHRRREALQSREDSRAYFSGVHIDEVEEAFATNSVRRLS